MRDRVCYVPRVASGPEEMRQAMAAYVRGIHQAYVDAAALLPPAERGRMPLLTADDITVAAVGTRVLHVIGTTERMPAPQGPEVVLPDSIDDLRWSLRFFDPVVLPALGLVDEVEGPDQEHVRRILGIRTVLYHLAVPPGASLTPHHASHAGTGLAHAHAAAARDFDAIRAHASTREALVDELQGAAVAGLPRAQVLLARELVPDLPGLSLDPPTDPAEIRKALLSRLRPARMSRP